jgi:RNA polymerase sigma factor (sigma-70 family)
VRPARALATDRPGTRPPLERRTAPVPTAPQRDVDALVTEHLPLAHFAVNAVASRISLPSHVSREDLVSCAQLALVERLGVAPSEIDALQVDVHRAVMVSIDADRGTDGGTIDLPDTGESPERALLRSERSRHLHEAIRALPDRLDEVVERNFFGDESLTEIAEDLGVTLSRVSQMRARALTLLHAAMSEVWEGRPVPADGGVRARNQQRLYVERVTGRVPAGPFPASRGNWLLPERGATAQPA